jgi:hypothetical protein
MNTFLDLWQTEATLNLPFLIISYIGIMKKEKGFYILETLDTWKNPKK